MKKIGSLLLAASCFTPAAFAADITTLGLLNQTEFRTLSEDLGAALSYKAVQPAETLGVTGFDVGIEVTETDISKSAAILSKASGFSSEKSKLYVPKLHVTKGLPFNIDVGAFISSVPSTNIKLVGAELKYAMLSGNVALPAVAIRAAGTRLSGVDQLSLNTKSVDLSISKGFTVLTPYAGLGRVWTDSEAHVGILQKEKFSQSKVFLGLNVNLGLADLAFEADETGDTRSYTAKMGFRF